MSKRKPGIAKRNRKLIQARLRKGDLQKHIADDLSVTPGAISHVLSHSLNYRTARRVGAEHRLNLAGERGYEPLKWQIMRFQSDFGNLPDHIIGKLASRLSTIVPDDDKTE